MMGSQDTDLLHCLRLLLVRSVNLCIGPPLFWLNSTLTPLLRPKYCTSFYCHPVNFAILAHSIRQLASFDAVLTDWEHRM